MRAKFDRILMPIAQELIVPDQLHNVTFDSESSLSDSALAPGGAWQVKFTKAGTYSYKCTLHPGMNGKITVS